MGAPQRYITKCRVITEKSSDLYAGKRLLFRKGLGLKKVGHIGDFWEKPKWKLWEEIKEREKRISDGQESPEIKRLIEHVKGFLGPDVSPKTIERNIGLHSQSPGIQQWCKEISEKRNDSIESASDGEIAEEQVHEPAICSSEKTSFSSVFVLNQFAQQIRHRLRWARRIFSAIRCRIRGVYYAIVKVVPFCRRE